MADFYGVTNDTGNRAGLKLSIFVNSTDAANNRSNVGWQLTIYDNAASLGGFADNGSWSATIGGVSYSGTLAYDFTANSGNSYLVVNDSRWINHNSTGGASVSGSASFTGNSTVGTGSVSGSISSPSSGMTDFVRVPQAPGSQFTPASAPAITRTGSGTTVTVSSQVAPDAAGSPAPPAITNYKYRYSTDNSTWTEVTGMGTDRVDTFGPTSPITVSATQVYYFQTAAYNSEGWGAWSTSGVGYAAPTITSLTRSGLSVAVAVAAASSNGGSTITSHVVERSSDNITWGNAQTISGASGGTTTFTGLAAGITWYFRAYATNQALVNSPYSATQSVFVSGYGKRYASTNEFVTITTGKRYDANGGGAGVPGWVDIQTAKKYASNPITGASGNGSVVTYTSTSHPFLVGDVVTITGINPGAYNLTNVTITSPITSNSFTVNSAATGAYVSGGSAVGWATFN